MSDPHPELARLRAAYRRVRRPDPELRARVARAVAADRRREPAERRPEAEPRREDAWRWIGGSLVGAALGMAALLAMHWIAVGTATRAPARRTPDAAGYQSPRKPSAEATDARGRPSTATEPDLAPQAPAGAATPPRPSPPPPLAPGGAAAAEPTPDATRRTPPSDARRSATGSAPGLTAEVRLLREAEVALSSDPARALSLLQTHARMHPHTSLPLERRALEILARCATSPGDAALRERDAFLREHPGSPYAARVRSACR